MNDIELLNNIKDIATKSPYYHQIKDSFQKETIINDVFISIWNSIRQGNMSSDWEDIKGYAFISCRNNSLQYLRKLKDERHRESGENALEVIYEDEIEDKIEYLNWIDNTLDEIFELIQVPIDREILKLRLRGYTLSQVADELGETYEEIYRISNNTRKYLRRQIDSPYFKPRKVGVIAQKYRRGEKKY
jgi:RNA polymerase sigma factor (sigma-70 family)